MWEIDLRDQIMSFLLSLPLGGALGAAFYLLEAFKAVFARGKASDWFFDILFSLLSGFITFCFLLVRSNGEIRGYILVGEAFGFGLFKLMASRPYCKIFSFLFSVLKTVYRRICGHTRIIAEKTAVFFKKSSQKLKIIRKKG